MTKIGNHATCNTSAVSTRSCPTYEHHGNFVHKWLTYVFFNPFLSLFYCIILSVRVCTLTSIPRISTGPWVGVSSSQTTSACQTWLEINNIFEDVLNTEIDKHANTHCFGNNFRPLSWSYLMCSFSPFLSEYTTMDNIEICTAATALTGMACPCGCSRVYFNIIRGGIFRKEEGDGTH